MVDVQAHDSRGYFMLPQAPEEAGYYVYGNRHGVPGTGHMAQYAHPALLSLIFYIEREWQALDERKFGIGNISIYGGKAYDKHATHKKGIEMDCRPVRRDKLVGQGARCTRFDAAYDRAATMRLIHLFVRHPDVRIVLFNDDEVQRALGPMVRSAPNHDDHFHVEVKEPRR